MMASSLAELGKMHAASIKLGRIPRDCCALVLAAALAAANLACNILELLPPTCPPEPTGIPTARSTNATLDAARLDALIQNYVRDTRAPSIAVGIVHGDELVFASAVGLADLATGRPATVDTLYEIGSVTKTFTATLLAMLVDDGVIQLDDPVAPFLPDDHDISDQPEIGDTITFRQLATHTSGLDRDAPNFALIFFGDHNFDADDLLLAAGRSPLLFSPGSGRSYSNLGYALLGLALENCTGQSYDTMLQSRILSPLGMEHTYVADRPEDFADIASGYLRLLTTWPVQPVPSGELSPAGAIVSNIPDMARYLSANLRAVDTTDTSRLSAAMRTALTLRVGPACGMSQALGWQTRDDAEFNGILWHGGVLNGQSAFVAIAPEADTGVVVLTNSWRKPEPLGYELMRVAIDTFGGAPPAARVMNIE